MNVSPLSVLRVSPRFGPLRPKPASATQAAGTSDPHARPLYEAYGRLRALLAFEHAVERRPRRVLEIAAGDAALSASLAAQGAEVVANDLRSEELDLAIMQFTTASRLACLGGNVFDLDPRIVGTFDLVIACEVIEHVAHPDELLRTLAGFVAPDGALLLTTPNGRYFRNQLPTFTQIGDPRQLEASQFKPDADGHLFLLTPGELTAMAGDVGLEIEHMLLWVRHFFPAAPDSDCCRAWFRTGPASGWNNPSSSFRRPHARE